METRTVKIFDNTIISASLNEIHCIDLLDRCSRRYDMVTSQEVYEEAKKGVGDVLPSNYGRLLQITDFRMNKRYSRLLSYLESRYPYLHKGELSSFLLALLKYELERLCYYYVTDDNRAKITFKRINEDIRFVRELGQQIEKFNVTGTIGLIRRLREHNLIKEMEIDNIISDLEKSTFYLTEELIIYLRGNKAED